MDEWMEVMHSRVLWNDLIWVKCKVPIEMESLHQSFNHPIHTKERYELEVSAGKLFLKGFAILR